MSLEMGFKREFFWGGGCNFPEILENFDLRLMELILQFIPLILHLRESLKLLLVVFYAQKKSNSRKIWGVHCCGKKEEKGRKTDIPLLI